jgi:hypothetical protein
MALQIDTSGTILFQQIGLDVQYSVDGSSSWVDISANSWPVTLNNTDASNTTLTAQFVTDLFLDSSAQYFILDSSNITIDGSNHIVTVDIIGTGYPGLVQNGTYYYDASGNVDSSGNTYSNIIIQNIVLNSNGSSLLAIARTTNDGANSTKYCNGWICQALFGLDGSNNSVNNCSSNGNTTTSYWVDSSGVQYNNNTGINNGGCILGDYCRAIVTNCESSGVIGLCAGGIFGRDGFGSATNCYSIGSIGQYAGGIYGIYSRDSAIATNCYSIGPIGQQAGGIFGESSSGSATNCYSTGPIGQQAGGIFGDQSLSQAQATNCYSTGTIGGVAGGIFGENSSGSATNCYSIGDIGQDAGGIFGYNSLAGANATNCYSTGTIGGDAGGIFGYQSSGSATNCYSTGDIGGNAGGIFGQLSLAGANATNCYSTGTIGGNAGGIFGQQSSGSATNCYSTGTTGIGAGGIFGQFSSGSATNCYYTNDVVNWLDASANAALDVSGTVWTDIDLSSNVVPYLLSAFTSTLYNPSSATDATTSGASIVTDSSYSIVSVNDENPSLYTGISIDVNTGDISFNSLLNGVYAVNVLATNANDGYSFGTFTNNSTSPLDASGTVLIKQDVGSDVQYSTDSGTSWTTAVWPVTLNNTDTANTLEVQFITDLSFNSLDQYFILDSSNILIDGSNNVVNINVNLYQGLVQNGTVVTSGNSFVTIQNLGVESTYTLQNNSGWIGRRYFGNNATDNLVTNCYSTGNIGTQSGGIFGQDSSGSATNCYSTGTIGQFAGGIFSYNSSGSATNCYSTGTIGNFGGGIFGQISPGSATNCYSTGTIGFQAGGIFGQNSSGSATNCYYTNGASNWLDDNADASLNVPGNYTDIDLSSNTVPYLLSAFTSTLYNPSSATDASNSGISIITDSSYSIVSVNDVNPSLYPEVTIDANTGVIDFASLSVSVYDVNVLATNTNDGYSFGTFTNTVSTIIDASGEISFRQDGANYQYSSDGVNWTNVSWPLSLINSGNTAPGARAIRAAGVPLIMTFTTDLSFNSADQYFIIDSSNITIDGSNHIVYVDVSTNDYPGLVQNGDNSLDGYSYVTIQNIGVLSSYSLADGGGWVGQQFFGNNATDNSIINCYSTGNMGLGGGGIVGGTSNVEASECYSTGDITGQYAGGIFGPGSLSQSYANNCYSTGDITGLQSGGIFGAGSESQSQATNCYSTGDIGQESGGIFGSNSSGSATNCYSTGTIGGGAGGIFGANSLAGANATNCYSIGLITDFGGGIFGIQSSGSATNCYSTGTIGNDAGGIFGQGSTGSATNCYYTNGVANWLDASANAALDLSGNPWTDIDTNSEIVPYRLSSFYINQSLYDPSSGTNVNPEIPDIPNPTDYTWSITSVNGSTSGQTGITIGVSNGDISFTSLSDATYAVNVLAEDSFGNYSFETFTNIISNICFPAGTPIVTNQGIIAINKINPEIHTIRNKKIVAITKTVSPDKYLVRFEKDALAANLPSEATTMTQNHMLFYKGKMMKAKEFLKTHNESVSKVPYKGTVLYNVLMEEHDKMLVNNLICETLHPENYVAQMHHALKVLTPRQRVEFIQKVNKEIIKRDLFSTFKKSEAKNGDKVRIQLSL